MAVEADNMLAEARVKLDALPSDPYSWENIRHTRPVPVTRVTHELEAEFSNLIRNGLLETDPNRRIEGMTPDPFTEYGQHIQAGLVALRRQLAMGDVLPMMNPAHVFLVGHGYEPTLFESD